MKQAVIVLVLASLAPGSEPIRVVTFNVRGDFDHGAPTGKPDGWLRVDGEHRRDLALRVVRDADADLIGVQEAYENQVREIDEALARHDVYAVGRDDGLSAGEHCAIYYRRARFERIASGTFWLSLTPDEPSLHPAAACARVASWVLLSDREAEGAELLLLNTHWDHVGEEARRHSARLIAERLPRLTDGAPAIVIGDFNAAEQSDSIRTLVESAGLRDAYRDVHPQVASDELTYHAFRGATQGTRIDYVFCSDALRATDAEILRPRFDGRLASDHDPVAATFEWAPGPAGDAR